MKKLNTLNPREFRNLLQAIDLLRSNNTDVYELLSQRSLKDNQIKSGLKPEKLKDSNKFSIRLSRGKRAYFEITPDGQLILLDYGNHNQS